MATSVVSVNSALATNVPDPCTNGEDVAAIGYSTTNGVGALLSAAVVNGATLTSCYDAGAYGGYSGPILVIAFTGSWPQNLFTSVAMSNTGAPGSPTYLSSAATYVPQGSSTSVNGFAIGESTMTSWVWGLAAGTHPDFNAAYETDLTFTYAAAMATPIGGQGDITDPGAWEDSSGNIPPLSYQNVPQTVNYPLNGDGRYWFAASAYSPTPETITFIGSTAFQVAGTMSLQASITQAANDGSELFLAYSLNGGSTWTATQLGPSLQSAPDIPNGPVSQSLLSATIAVPLVGTTSLQVKVYSSLGTASSTAQPWNVAVAITRNANEAIAWDYPNPFDPISYNCECMDDVTPTDTLANLRAQMINRLGFKLQNAEVTGLTLTQMQTYLLQRIGFASQTSNPPPGMLAFCTAIINEAQQDLYRRYAQDTYSDAAPSLLVNGTDTLTLDNEAVKILAVAKAKGHYGAPDSAAMMKAFEQYLQDLYTRQPPNLINDLNSFLIEGQKYLYRRYNQLHTRRLFRWKVNPGQRFYSLKDNDEDVLCNYTMDPMKDIEWAGIQDSRNVWYPLTGGIPPQLYTMIDKPWRPARFEIRQCIEIYPAPDQTYWMWFKAHFGLRAFAQDTDSTTIDSELLFLHALANAKAHYKQPDAANVEAMANNYRKELIAGTHGGKKYIPGTIAVPPAVRPTLINYNNG